MSKIDHDVNFICENEINIINPEKNKVGRPKRKYPKKYSKIPTEKRWGRNKVYCKICNCFLQQRIMQQHRKTLKHQKNFTASKSEVRLFHFIENF